AAATDRSPVPGRVVRRVARRRRRCSSRRIQTAAPLRTVTAWLNRPWLSGSPVVRRAEAFPRATAYRRRRAGIRGMPPELLETIRTAPRRRGDLPPACAVARGGFGLQDDAWAGGARAPPLRGTSRRRGPLRQAVEPPAPRLHPTQGSSDSDRADPPSLETSPQTRH